MFDPSAFEKVKFYLTGSAENISVLLFGEDDKVALLFLSKYIQK